MTVKWSRSMNQCGFYTTGNCQIFRRESRTKLSSATAWMTRSIMELGQNSTVCTGGTQTDCVNQTPSDLMSFPTLQLFFYGLSENFVVRREKSHFFFVLMFFFLSLFFPPVCVFIYSLRVRIRRLSFFPIWCLKYFTNLGLVVAPIFWIRNYAKLFF